MSFNVKFKVFKDNILKETKEEIVVANNAKQAGKDIRKKYHALKNTAEIISVAPV